jgi:hypothetical protein
MRARYCNLFDVQRFMIMLNMLTRCCTHDYTRKHQRERRTKYLSHRVHGSHTSVHELQLDLYALNSHTPDFERYCKYIEDQACAAAPAALCRPRVPHHEASREDRQAALLRRLRQASRGRHGRPSRLHHRRRTLGLQCTLYYGHCQVSSVADMSGIIQTWLQAMHR